jgi:hypothetical protein
MLWISLSIPNSTASYEADIQRMDVLWMLCEIQGDCPIDPREKYFVVRRVRVEVFQTFSREDLSINGHSSIRKIKKVLNSYLEYLLLNKYRISQIHRKTLLVTSIFPLICTLISLNLHLKHLNKCIKAISLLS